MVKYLVNPSHGVIWKIENVPNKLLDLPKNISKQNVETVNQYIFSTYNKLQEEQYELKRDLSSFQAELFF